MTGRDAKNSPTDRWLEEHPEGISDDDLTRWYEENEGRAKEIFERYLREHPQLPNPMALYFHRAASLLSGRSKIKLTPEMRAKLERHYAESTRVARKLWPLNPELTALLVLVEIVTILRPVNEAFLNRLLSQAPVKARAALAQKTESDVINVVIAEETKRGSGLSRNVIRKRVNKELEKRGIPEITYDALRGRQKRQNKRSS